MHSRAVHIYMTIKLKNMNGHRYPDPDPVGDPQNTQQQQDKHTSAPTFSQFE